MCTGWWAPPRRHGGYEHSGAPSLPRALHQALPPCFVIASDKNRSLSSNKIATAAWTAFRRIRSLGEPDSNVNSAAICWIGLRSSIIAMSTYAAMPSYWSHATESEQRALALGFHW